MKSEMYDMSDRGEKLHSRALRRQGDTGLPPSDIREKARAAVTMVQTARTEEEQAALELEGFMGVFFPEKQKDRAFMRDLRRAAGLKR